MSFEEKSKASRPKGIPQLVFQSNVSGASPTPDVSKPTVQGSFISHENSISLLGITYDEGDNILGNDSDSDSDVEDTSEKSEKAVEKVEHSAASEKPVEIIKRHDENTVGPSTPPHSNQNLPVTPAPAINVELVEHGDKPVITSESKDRIINRVQTPVKSKQDLKKQEEKLKASKIKNEKNQLKKQDPNNLPFDFQRFLVYLRSKSADSIVRYLKSFLIAFSKKNWTVSEQVKLISDFKNFIYDRMLGVLPFSKMNQTEFINCQEGMEKLIMNRLYDQVFSPVIHQGKLNESHKQDIYKDELLKNQILRFSWVTNEHLDLNNQFVEQGHSFINLAIAELMKINNYRSPRDKIICILNCCKVIFAMLKNSALETNADAFIPSLIYIVLKTDEDLRLNSNISYIERFRNEDGLSGEVNYYVSSFWAVIGFIENLNKDSLTITQESWDLHMKPYEETNKNELADNVLNQPHPEQNLSPPVAIKQTFSPLQSLQSFFQSGLSGIENYKLLDDENSPKGTITTQTLVAPQQDSQILTTPAILNFSENALRKPISQNKAEKLALKAFEHEKIQLIETLVTMFPTLDRAVISDIVDTNDARENVCVDSCLKLVD